MALIFMLLFHPWLLLLWLAICLLLLLMVLVVWLEERWENPKNRK
ncbi:MAG: hypothetical protein ACK44F_08800 [Roseococcus sp.]|jgi:hypothetical protein